MGDNFILRLFIIQVISILILLGIIIFLLKVSRAMKKEKRIGKFSLYAISDNDISYFERIDKLVWKLVHLLSYTLNKSVVMKKYASKYEKFITYEQRDFKNAIDYISMKFLIGLLLLIFSLLTTMFQYIDASLMFYLIAFLIGFFLPDIVLNLDYRKKRIQVGEDLLKAIIIMNNSFKSGRNIMQAIEIVKRELDGPIKDEFSKIYMDMTYGLSLEVVFDRFYERIKLDDAKYIASSLTLLNKTGGNIIKVFGSIEKTFYDKKKLKNELNSMTASSVFVYRVLVFLPFVFVVLISILNPAYFLPLVTTSIGYVLLGIILIIFSLYVIIIKRILKVDI